MEGRKKINSNGKGKVKAKNNIKEKAARLRKLEDEVIQKNYEIREIRDYLTDHMKLGAKVQIPKWNLVRLSKANFYMTRETALKCLSQAQYIAYSRPDIAGLRKAFGEKWIKKNADKAEKINYVAWEGRWE